MSDDAAEDTDPADAFLIPAHEIRLGILEALWRAENHSLSFSELRKEVGVRDTGKFTYHLSKLTGRYVAHVEDRYELLYPGHRVVDAIQSGVFDAEVETDQSRWLGPIRTATASYRSPTRTSSSASSVRNVRRRCWGIRSTLVGSPTTTTPTPSERSTGERDATG